jgi:hypothetical protein
MFSLLLNLGEVHSLLSILLTLKGPLDLAVDKLIQMSVPAVDIPTSYHSRFHVSSFSIKIILPH